MTVSNVVHLSLQVLLKIAQHARKSNDQPLTGQLLGMEQEEGGILQVTDSFPFTTTNLTDEAEVESYQVEMLKCLRDVNVDHSTVGWYWIGRFAGSGLSGAFLEAQANYQSTIPCSISLVYDAGLAAVGLPAGGPPPIRALRLRPNVLAHLTAGKQQQRWIDAGEDIFEELSIVYSLSSLDELLTLQLAQLAELPPAGPLASLGSGVQTKKAALYQVMEHLLSGLDEHLGESGRLQHYYRTVHKACQVHGIQKSRRGKNAATAEEDESQPQTVLVKNAHEPSMLALRCSLLHLQALSAVCKELQAHLQAAAASQLTI